MSTKDGQSRLAAELIRTALELSGDPAELQRFYETWAENYDRDIAAEGYIAPRVLVEMLPLVGMSRPDPTLEILDAGCGTGIVGRLLHERGFCNIDGFDLSKPMVEQAEALGVYRRLQGDIDMNQPLLTYAPQSYDVILCCGVFTHGHVPPESLVHLIRLGKPGGRLLLSTRTTYCDETDYPGIIAKFVTQGLLTQLHQLADAPYTQKDRAHYWAYCINQNTASDAGDGR